MKLKKQVNKLNCCHWRWKTTLWRSSN